MSHPDQLFCELDEVMADVARDALQNFVLVSGSMSQPGRILRASKATQRLFEYHSSRNFPHTLQPFYGERTSQDDIKRLTDCMTAGESFDGNLVLYKSNDDTFWANLTMEPIFDQQSIICFAIFIRDIDELKDTTEHASLGAKFVEGMEEDHREQHRLVQMSIRSTLVLQPGTGANAGVFTYAARGEGKLSGTLTEYNTGNLAGLGLDALYGEATAMGDRKQLADALKEHEPLSCDILSYTKTKEPWWRHMLVVPIAGECFLTFNVNCTRARRYVGRYQLGTSVGRGSFGTVKVAQNMDSGAIVALKKVDATNPRIEKLVDLEVKIQRALVDPCVIQLLDVMKVGTSVFMVMEFAQGGSIFDRIVSRGKIAEDRAASLFRQMAESVAYCHSKKVCHRDLKPENMLLDKTGNKVKLIDFGLAAFFDKERKLTEVCGSKRFQAPEVYRKRSGSSGSSSSAGYEGPPVDIWSLGVVLFELVHGQIRMSGSDASLTTVQFIENALKKHLKDKTFSPELVQLLRGVLQLEPRRRPAIRDILAHPWLTQNTVKATAAA